MNYNDNVNISHEPYPMLSTVDDLTPPSGHDIDAQNNHLLDALNDKTKTVQVNLRKIPLLANLTDEEMGIVKRELRIRRYARRETIIQKGSPGDSLVFLLSGKLQVTDVTDDGRMVSLRTLSEGDFFGEISVIQSSVRTASVIALSEALIAFLPGALALHLFSNSPSVAKYMLHCLAAKIQQDSQFRSLLGIHNISKRIYTFLVLMKETKPGNLEVIENLPTHQDIASMINTSRETVTRTLIILVQQGILQKDLHRLIIRKPEALQQLTQGDTL